MILYVVPAIRRISLPFIKRFAGIIMAAFFICMFLSVPALATGYRLNSGGPQVVSGSLSMVGGRVIWADNRTGTKQIYVKDIAAGGAETPVQTTLNNQVTPAISGSIVVWQENSDLYYKDLSGGSAVQLTDNGATYPKRTPAIYGNRVVWSEDHGTRDLVYTKLLADMGNGTAVDTADTIYNQTAPAVSADYIIWAAGNTLTGITDLRIKKTTSIMYGPADFCTATGSQLNPKISGNLVAWEDTRDAGGISQIYYYDLNLGQPATPATTGLQLSATSFAQTRPDVSINRIAWTDERTGGKDVYMKDLVSGMETALVADANTQDNPAINGDRVAWETYRQDDTGWGWDVNFMRTDGGAGLTVYSTGFEVGSVSDAVSGWTNTAGGSSTVKWGEKTNKPHNGAQSLWMAGNGGTIPNYSNNMNSTVSRSVDLTGFTDATLTFWYWSKWPGDDYQDSLWVQYTTEQNPSLYQDLFISNYTDTPFSVWRQKTINISALTGKVVKLYFRGYSDGTLTDQGAYVDDVAITAKSTWSLDHVHVSPTNATLPAGGTQGFAAVGHDLFDNTISGRTFNWTAMGGSFVPTSGDSTTYTAPTSSGPYTVTATDAGSSKLGTAGVTVTPGALDHITITPGSATLSLQGTQSFTAQGYDAYNNPISGLVYNWEATGGTVLPQNGGTNTFTAGTTAGTSFYVRVSSGTPSAQAAITITPGALQHIDVSPASASLSVGGTQSFTAEGQDQYHNVISGLPFTWAATGGTVPAGTESSKIYTAGTTAGTGYYVRASSGGVNSPDAAITINPGALNHIHLSPASASLSVGGTQSFTAEGQDQYHNVISGLPFTWAATGGTVPAGTESSKIYTAGTTAGTGYYVRASSGGVNSPDAAITINPGALDHIDVTPSSATLIGGTSLAFTAQGKDLFGNSISGLNYDWSAAFGSVNPASGTTTTHTAPASGGGYNLTVTSGSKSKDVPITIAPQLTRIDISPVSASLGAGATQGFSATGYDQYEQVVPGLVYSWTATGGTVDPASGGSTTYTAGGTLGAGYYVRASSGGVNSSDAAITINPGALDHITITPGSATLSLQGTQSFTAQGYDAYNNPISGLVYNWEATGGTVLPQNGGTNTFTAGTTAGTSFYVRVSSGTPSAQAAITITPGALQHIDVSPASASLSVGGTQSFTAEGQDQYHNVISGLPFTWAATGGTVPAGTESSKIYTAGTTAGTGYYVRASSGGVNSPDAAITINPGALNHIHLSPASASLSVGGTQSFTAEGQDQYHNVISGLPFTWAATGGTVPAGTESSKIYTAGTTAGTGYYVRASSGGVNSPDAAITITPGALQHIDVSPASASLSVGGTQSFTAEGQDQYHNVISGLPFTWAATGGTVPAGTESSKIYTAGTTAGTGYYVRASSGGVNSPDAAITITPGALEHIVVTPGSATLNISGTQGFTAQGYDVYNNQISGLTYTWTATGGGVSPGSGSSTTYTAGTTAGSGYFVRASSSGVSAEVPVTIQPPPSNHGYVVSLYRTLLQRGPTWVPDAWSEANEIAPWVNALNSGAFTREGMAFAMMTSHEYHMRMVREMYEVVLGRTAEISEQHLWANGMDAGLTLRSMRAQIYGSQEFAYTYPSSFAYVEFLYTKILNRSASDPGAQGWVNALNNGSMSRSQTAYSIMCSDEYYTGYITSKYVDILGRAPEPGGLASWLGGMRGGMTEEVLPAQLYASQEYFTTHANI